jgi:putative copper resistance protein D
MLDYGLIASRWLHLTSVTVLFGVALFGLYAPRTALVGARRSWWLLVAAPAAVGSAIAWFVFSAAAMSMAINLSDVSAAIPTVLAETDFGRVWSVRVVIALTLCAPSVARARWPNLVLTGALLASLALTGHAQMHEPPILWLQAAVDAAHLLAAGAWLGALSAFLLLLRRSPLEPETARALSDFAAVGSIAVATLIASGVANAWFVLGGIRPLVASHYGRLLLLKVGLFLVMVALAAANRFRVVPAFAAHPSADAAAGVRRCVLAEQLLGLTVLLIVSAIGTLDPTA